MADNTLNLSLIKPINNYILVKPARKDDELMLSDGNKIYINPSFEREKHAPSSGTVVALPEKIKFSKEGFGSSNEFDVDMELQLGDIVIYHFLTMSNCIERKQYIVQDGEIYIWMKYDQCFVAKRGGQVIPINGWVAIEPIEEEIKSTVFIPKHIRSKKSLTMGIVRYAGMPIRNYLFNTDKFDNTSGDTDEIKEGDKVIFGAEDSVPFEYELHAQIDKGKTLYRAQRRDLLAVEEILGG